jgi:hypothetical protein
MSGHPGKPVAAPAFGAVADHVVTLAEGRTADNVIDFSARSAET